MKLIVTSHGELCTGIMKSLEMIAGKYPDIIALPLKENDTGEYKKNLEALIQDAIKSEPVLILCDIIGGTPYNESYHLQLLHPESVLVVSGLNLAMLIETAIQEKSFSSLKDLAVIAEQAGHISITIAGTEPEDKEEEIEF